MSFRDILLLSGLVALGGPYLLHSTEHNEIQLPRWTLFLGSLIFLILTRSIYSRIFDPLKGIPTVKFPTRRAQFRALFLQVDRKDALAAAREHPESDFLRHKGLQGQQELILLSPQARREVLSTKFADFQRPEVIRERIRLVTGNGLLVAEGQDHKLQRKGLLPAFSIQHVRSLAPTFWQKSVEMVEALAKHVSQNPGEEVEIYDFVSRASLDIIGVAAWGKDFGSLADPDQETVSRYKKMIKPSSGSVLFLALLSVLPRAITRRTKRGKEIRSGIQAMRAAAAKAVQERKESKLEGRKDILSVAMRNNAFEDEQLVEMLLTMISAGHETSATATGYASFFLATNPEVQDKLRKEVRDNLPPPSSDREVNWEDLEALSYLRGCSLEALRLAPAASGSRRCALRDTVICGQVIPQGTMMTSNVWLNGFIGFDNPEQFNPDRWLGSNADALRNGSTGEYKFSAFSHGVRACIGQTFARLEGLALLAALAGQFEIRIDDPEFPMVNMAVTSVPTRPIKLRLRALDGR